MWLITEDMRAAATLGDGNMWVQHLKMHDWIILEKILLLVESRTVDKWINGSFVSVLTQIKTHLCDHGPKTQCVFQCSTTNGSQETLFGSQH